MLRRSAWLGIAALTACQQPTEDPAVRSARSGEAALVVADTTLWLTPTDAEEVANPFGPGTTSNWVARLVRGLEATVTDRSSGWSELRLEGDARGWALSDMLLPAELVQPATVIAETHAIADDGAPYVLPAGALLFASAEQREGRIRVNVNAQTWAWVEPGSVEKDPAEIAISKMLQRARANQERGDRESNARMFDKARVAHPDAKLLDAFADYVSFQHFSLKPAPDTSP